MDSFSYQASITSILWDCSFNTSGFINILILISNTILIKRSDPSITENEELFTHFFIYLCVCGIFSLVPPAQLGLSESVSRERGRRGEGSDKGGGVTAQILSDLRTSHPGLSHM